MALTDEQQAELFNVLGLHDSFVALEYGGLLKQLDFTFRLADTTDNKIFLEHLFGIDWANYVELRGDSDDGVNTDSFGGTLPSNDGTLYFVALTRYYNHYYFHKDKFENMTGERISEVVNKAMSFIVNTEQPCPDDKFIIIVAIIALTIATILSGGLTGPALYAAIASAVISIGLTIGTFGKKEREYAQYAQYALAIYAGYQAAIASNGTWVTTMQGGLQIANTAIAGFDFYSQNQFEESKKELEEEYERVSENLAEEFEKAFNFYYEDSYEYIYRAGHEAHPHKYVRETYKEFSVY